MLLIKGAKKKALGVLTWKEMKDWQGVVGIKRSTPVVGRCDWLRLPFWNYFLSEDAVKPTQINCQNPLSELVALFSLLLSPTTVQEPLPAASLLLFFSLRWCVFGQAAAGFSFYRLSFAIHIGPRAWDSVEFTSLVLVLSSWRISTYTSDETAASVLNRLCIQSLVLAQGSSCFTRSDVDGFALSVWSGLQY